ITSVDGGIDASTARTQRSVIDAVSNVGMTIETSAMHAIIAAVVSSRHAHPRDRRPGPGPPRRAGDPERVDDRAGFGLWSGGLQPAVAIRRAEARRSTHRRAPCRARALPAARVRRNALPPALRPRDGDQWRDLVSSRHSLP